MAYDQFLIYSHAGIRVIIWKEPTVAVIARPQLLWDNIVEAIPPFVDEMNDCGMYGPDYRFVGTEDATDAAHLCEIAGRICYASFNKKMGRSDTQEYLDHIKEVGHKSVLYHANFSFFVSNISRRLSLELNRHIIGVSRSQLSTRFVQHNGSYVAHPRIVSDDKALVEYAKICWQNYADYLKVIDGWDKLKGLQRKRVLEAGSNILNQGAATALVVTYNVESFRKMYYERSANAADLEFQRLVRIMGNEIVRVEPVLFSDVKEYLDSKQGAQ